MYWPVAIEISFKKIYIFLALVAMLFNLLRGHHGEYFCEIILNSDQCFRRTCGFKIILI